MVHSSHCDCSCMNQQILWLGILGTILVNNINSINIIAKLIFICN